MYGPTGLLAKSSCWIRCGPIGLLIATDGAFVDPNDSLRISCNESLNPPSTALCQALDSDISLIVLALPNPETTLAEHRYPTKLVTTSFFWLADPLNAPPKPLDVS